MIFQEVQMVTRVLTPEILFSARHILVVCAGNTCRSPMIEAKLRSLYARYGKETIVESAGINSDAADRLPANEEWFKIIDETGYDLSGHASRRIDEVGPLSNFDLIICVTQKVLDEVVKAGIGDATITLFTPEGLTDPYQLGTDKYRLCFHHIDRVFGNLTTAPLPKAGS